MTIRSVQVYSTLSKQKETLRTIEPGHVRMYACGTTVYDDNHLGHGMQAVFFDMIRNYLKAAGYKVTYVRNYTDVDDKIIKRAESLGISPKKLSSDLIDQGEKELALLGVALADHQPRVSTSIDDIIAMIEELIKKDYAYVTEEGDVYYRVRRKADYGKLSHRSIDELYSGTRDIVTGIKEDPLDFALWKKDTTADASWNSPWSLGRPGWHIECSAMSKKYLGKSFDIHGGGKDLEFPHHENEIAQSEAANDAPYASCWLHSGLLTVGHQKMSKSLGNFITLRDFLSKWPGEVLRISYLQNHYRSNIDFSEAIFQQSRRKLLYFYETILAASALSSDKELEGQLLKDLQAKEESFHAAMCDDFNTPEALAELQIIARTMNQLLAESKKDASRHAVVHWNKLFLKLGNILGLFHQAPDAFISELKDAVLKEIGFPKDELLEMIEKRNFARQEKNWALSDQIRNELQTKGIALKDGPLQTEWTVSFNG